MYGSEKRYLQTKIKTRDVEKGANSTKLAYS